ncbi:MAG: hypothetical protein MJ182_02355 [Treponema sp.]|nr:hypothetical protein [Treponema sp.]
MSEKISTKTFFINYTIFAGIILGVLGILIYTVFASRVAWNNNLKYSIEKVLEENEPGSWSVGSPIEINNPLTLRSGCYGARNRKTGDMHYAFITRIPTVYGPMGAVFTCTLEGEVKFEGYSSLHGRILKQISQSKYDTRLQYFSERIPGIIGIEKGEKND